MSTALPKLLQLPWNAKIILSFVSPDLYALAKSANRRLEHIQWIFDDDDYQFGTSIELAATKETEEYTIKFPCAEEMENIRKECCDGEQYTKVFTKFTLQGTVYFLCTTQKYNQPQIVVDYGQPAKELQMKAMKLFSEHLWNLFSYEKTQLLFLSNDKISDCIIFDITKQFTWLDIENHDECEPITRADIQFLLETLKCDEIEFKPFVEDRVYFRPLTVKHITMESARWLPIESLVKSESISISICENSLEDDDLNMIVRAWMEGGLPNLQCLTMSFEGSNPVHNRNGIFRGVWNTPFDATNRPPYFQNSWQDWVRNEDAVDIKTNDGSLTATVTLGRVHSRPGFGMFVWQDTYNLRDD